LRETEPSEADRETLRSPFFNEEKVLSLDRWVFWKSKFRELAELEISQAVRTEATRAAQIMDQVESGQREGRFIGVIGNPYAGVISSIRPPGRNPATA